MSQRIMTISALMLSFTVSMARTGEKSGDDSKSIQGAWRCVNFVQNGKKEPEDQFKRLSYVFIGDKLRTKYEDKEVGEAQFKLDSSTNPRQIDVNHKEDPLIGIYRLAGDKLTICACPAKANKKRPTEFASTRDTGSILIMLERQK